MKRSSIPSINAQTRRSNASWSVNSILYFVIDFSFADNDWYRQGWYRHSDKSRGITVPETYHGQPRMPPLFWRFYRAIHFGWQNTLNHRFLLSIVLFWFPATADFTLDTGGSSLPAFVHWRMGRLWSMWGLKNSCLKVLFLGRSAWRVEQEDGREEPNGWLCRVIIY